MPHADPSKIEILAIDPHRGTVACPRRGCEVPYEDCVSCEFAWLVDLGTDAANSHVVCEVVPRVAAGEGQGAPVSANAATTPVSEIMTPKVISVHANLPLERVILLLIDEDISGAPVLDDDGHPIGIVSRSDLVTDDYDWADLRDDFLSYPRVAPGSSEELFLPELFHSRCARDIMSPVVKVSTSTSIARAALAITNSHSHRALVVTPEDQLAGIVTEFDLARWVASTATAEAS